MSLIGGLNENDLTGSCVGVLSHDMVALFKRIKRVRRSCWRKYVTRPSVSHGLVVLAKASLPNAGITGMHYLVSGSFLMDKTCLN